MPVREAEAKWIGGLKDGEGSVALGSGAFEGNFDFGSRFEDGDATNPEELIGAAHAGCFSMAFSLVLEENGYDPESIETDAEVTIEQVGEDFEITEIALDTVAEVPELEDDEFQELANVAKENCPVSVALAGPEITLTASLK
jgi:osmotically inducible protein OsmC